MTPYQVSSEIYGGFFYSGITLTTLKPAFSNASTNANNMDDASEINKLTSVCHASVLLAIEDTRICAVIDKTKFNRQTQAKAKSSEPSKLFGLEVIWIQCFHWPNITTYATHHCLLALYVPERYFAFTRGANASISASTTLKKENSDLCA